MKRVKEYNKIIGEFKRVARIKECYHYNHEECSENIISAHSVQRSGRLSLLEEKRRNNMVLYSTLKLNPDPKNFFWGFKPLGKKEASTFFGFCSYHDKVLFNEIENFPTDIDDDKHLFLHSYRSHAHEYHAKKEVLQAYQSDCKLTSIMSYPVLQSKIDGSIIGLRDLGSVKDRFNDVLRNHRYSDLHYFAIVLDGFYPIACSTSFSPEYSIYDKAINISNQESFIYESVIMTVLPDKEGTIVILACLPEHTTSVKFIKEVESLTNKELKSIISSLIIGYAENTFFSPSIWSKMIYKEQEGFMNDLKMTAPDVRVRIGCFYHCKTNLFADKFRK